MSDHYPIELVLKKKSVDSDSVIIEDVPSGASGNEGILDSVIKTFKQLCCCCCAEEEYS